MEKLGKLGLAIAIVLCAILLKVLMPFIDGDAYRSKPRPSFNTCTSHLKEVGLSFRIWEGDHPNNYTFNVSTNQGGTFELCDRDTNGFERASWRHFLVMSNELANPKILVCPQDKSKIAATNWQTLGPSNVTYLIRSGTNVDETHPGELLVYCPVCGAKCYADGSVQLGPKK